MHGLNLDQDSNEILSRIFEIGIQFKHYWAVLEKINLSTIINLIL